MTYIIIGAILATIGLSLLSGISELITLIFEVWKARLALKIAKINTLITEQTAEDQLQSTNVVGFTIPNEKEEDDEEYG